MPRPAGRSEPLLACLPMDARVRAIEQAPPCQAILCGLADRSDLSRLWRGFRQLDSSTATGKHGTSAHHGKQQHGHLGHDGEYGR
jgi:hypothetical protein